MLRASLGKQNCSQTIMSISALEYPAARMQAAGDDRAAAVW
jgi:hypothetical protein